MSDNPTPARRRPPVVTSKITERVDSIAARAFWRLLFGNPHRRRRDPTRGHDREAC